MVEAAQDEALLAVDLYNRPKKARHLEGFYVHMHMSWLYLLHAEFVREKVDCRYRLPNGRFDRVDGEPKTWDLMKSVATRLPNSDDPVRKNLEFTIQLRNKIEHRYQEAIGLATEGYAQALVLNFEEELISLGRTYSLGDALRFPIFVGSITAVGQARIEELRNELPVRTRDFIAAFEAGLSSDVVQDCRFDFRLFLIPKLGTKAGAEQALEFVREGDLTDEQREILEALGQSGKVIVREQLRAVSSHGLMKPSAASRKIERRIPFKFSVYAQYRYAWLHLNCRPASGAERPERTDEKYCVYDEPHRDYLYTDAFVDRVVRECSTAEGFEHFIGRAPVLKIATEAKAS